MKTPQKPVAKTNMYVPQILQFKIELKDSKPNIWRRVLVPENITFFEFHNIIQVVMGWTNSHLFAFNIGKQRIEVSDPDFDMGFGSNALEASKTFLSSFMTTEKQKMVYEYDFGDFWEHKITLEKILPFEENTVYPVCTAGKMNCPPEDCGGIYGFYQMLEIIADKKHPEHKGYKQWLGKYDPAYFDLDETNEGLRSS